MIKGHRFQKHLSWSFYKTQNFSVPFLIAPDQNRKLILQLAVSLSLKNLKKKMGSRISLEKRGNRSVQESDTGNEINICIFRFYFCQLKNIEIYRFLSPGGGKLPFVKLQCVFILK